MQQANIINMITIKYEPQQKHKFDIKFHYCFFIWHVIIFIQTSAFLNEIFNNLELLQLKIKHFHTLIKNIVKW